MPPLFKSAVQAVGDLLAETKRELADVEAQYRGEALEAALADDLGRVAPLAAKVAELRQRLETLATAAAEAKDAERRKGIEAVAIAHRKIAIEIRAHLKTTLRVQAEMARHAAKMVECWLRLNRSARLAVEALPRELRTQEKPYHEAFSMARLRDDLMVELYRLAGGEGAEHAFVERVTALEHGVAAHEDSRGNVREMMDEVRGLARDFRGINYDLDKIAEGIARGDIPRSMQAKVAEPPKATPVRNKAPTPSATPTDLLIAVDDPGLINLRGGPVAAVEPSPATTLPAPVEQAHQARSVNPAEPASTTPPLIAVDDPNLINLRSTAN